MSDRILRDLHHHGVTRLECEFDAARLAFEACGVPVHLTGVKHRVATTADVHEGRLHTRQHILNTSQIDVACHRLLSLVRDVVLDEHLIFEHSNLYPAVLLPHDHVALDGLPPGQKLGLGNGRTAPLAITVIPAALTLGLQTR